ncbi:MAG: glycosyltransferase family 2 protein [Thermoanaerobaculia bacterium]
MANLVTVLVPTHAHGATLGLAVRSALAQTVEEMEILVVGDGACEETREVARQLERLDRRVRFLDFPKGERHGERHRHAALDGARGDLVAYLADDDLWLPDHLAHLSELLAGADFAAGTRLMIHPSGEAEIERVDLARPFVRERLLAGLTNVPLSVVGHTLRVYRELPFGWRPAPAGFSPPLHMWQQFLSHAACRAVAGTRVTSVNFPAAARDGWANEERAREIAPIARRLCDPAFREDLLRRALDSALRKWAALEGHVHDLGGHIAYLQRELDALRGAAASSSFVVAP